MLKILWPLLSVAKCSCTKLKRHEFLQHSPECENYQAAIQNIKPCKNRALVTNLLANNVSPKFYSLSIVNPGATPLRERSFRKLVYDDTLIDTVKRFPTASWQSLQEP